MRERINLQDAKVLATELGCPEAARRLGVKKSYLYYHSRRRKWNLRLMQWVARRRRWFVRYLAARDADWHSRLPRDYMSKARESYFKTMEEIEQKRHKRLVDEQRRQAILEKYPPT